MADINTLYTYGGGQILAEVFNGIAAAVGDDAYKSVLRLGGLFALLWVIAEVSINANYMRLLTWLGSFFILLNVLLVPKMTIVVVDKINTGFVRPVDNVPIGVGYFAVISSQIGYALTSLCDEVFTLPDDLQYSQTGLVMGSRLVSDAMRFQITDPTFSQNMTSFMQQCVFYDLLLGKYSATDLFTTTDLWSFITQNASPARAFKYATSGGIGSSSTIYTCRDGVQTLRNDWNKEIQQAATVYGQRFFVTNNTNAKSELLSRLPIAMNYLTSTSKDGTQIMMQAMTANAIQHALLSNGAEAGASAAVGQYASTRAEQMQISKFLITGDLAAHWLSVMQNVIQALLYGGFIIVVLTMLMPVGFRVVASYLQSILWVQLWAPLYAILNLVMTMGAQHESMSAIANMGGAATEFTLNTYAGLAKVNADMSAFAGFATMSIPLIAWGLVKFTGLAVTSLASSLASVGQSVASRVAEEVTSGNLSYGNLQYDTQSAFNTSANHFNTNESYQAGMTSYQTASGAILQHTQDGSTVINSQGAISSTGTSINLADSMRAQASTQADHALTAAYNQATAFSSSMSSVFRHMQDFSHSFGNNKSSDNSYSESTSSSIANAADKVGQSIDRFAADHHLSNEQSARILGEAYAKVSAGVSVPGRLFSASGGASVSASGSGSASTGETWRDAQDVVSQSSFRQNVDTVIRAAHDEHYRTGNDSSDRALSNMSSAYDSALSARNELSNNLSLADSYRKTASFAQDNAVSVNTNNSQAFVNWLMEQPNEHGGTLGSVGAEQVLNNNPNLAREYANQFISGEVNKLENRFQSQSHHSSESSITSDYQTASRTTQSSATTQMASSTSSNNQSISNAATQSGVIQSVNSGLQAEVNQSIGDAQIQQHAMQIATEQAMQTTTKEKLHLSTTDKSLAHQALTESKDLVKDTL